jgi:hypothetical protein
MPMHKYAVYIKYAFGESFRFEFDSLVCALQKYESAKESANANPCLIVHHVGITPPDGYGVSWTNPRYLDLTEMGGEKGADFEKMRDWSEHQKE